jgi:hypothetical protein
MSSRTYSCGSVSIEISLFGTRSGSGGLRAGESKCAPASSDESFEIDSSSLPVKRRAQWITFFKPEWASAQHGPLSREPGIWIKHDGSGAGRSGRGNTHREKTFPHTLLVSRSPCLRLDEDCAADREWASYHLGFPCCEHGPATICCAISSSEESIAAVAEGDLPDARAERASIFCIRQASKFETS